MDIKRYVYKRKAREKVIYEGGEKVESWEGGDGGMVVIKLVLAEGDGLRDVEDFVHVNFNIRKLASNEQKASSI